MPHLNTHFAIGSIFASIGAWAGWISLEPRLWGIPALSVPFLVVVGLSVAVDFDFVFGTLAGVENHRRLVTHSVWPGIALVVIGIVVPYAPVVLGGAAMLLHVGLDAVDWGTNLWGDGTLRGPKILVKGREDQLPGLLARVPRKQCFFTLTWYESRAMQALEGVVLGGFLVTGLVSTLGWQFFVVYVPLYGLCFVYHFRDYLRCRHLLGARLADFLSS